MSYAILNGALPEPDASNGRLDREDRRLLHLGTS
jgi:hypothetical protein